jgi:hypothetical protein
VNRRHHCKSRWLLILVLSAIPLRRPANATGIEDPIRWLGVGSQLGVAPPEFYFELESKRIARDLHPEFKAITPPGNVGEKDYAKQTNDADLADFEDALKSGALRPPDAQKARAANAEMIKLLGRKPKESDNADPTESSPDLPSGSPSPTASATPTPASTAALPDEFPSEFADYHTGAIGYHSGDTAGMQKHWQALLDRPTDERKYRTTWAEYMLGKTALDDDHADEARAHFQKLREAAKKGFVDSLGLAAASVGWEASIELTAEHFPEAARLYLEQLAAGDVTAVNSLRTLLDQVLKHDSDLPNLMSDPLMQRLATAATLSGIGTFGGSLPDSADPGPLHPWLAVLEKADARQVKDADCVAWLYYERGDYKAAERWLKLGNADSPYALWLRAKLALRDGKVDVAAQLLSRAVPNLPQEHDLEAYYMGYGVTTGDASKGDLGLLRMGRSEFIAAAKLFLRIEKSDDAEYVAEAVMTLPELNSFIETELPEKPKVAQPPNEVPVENKRETFRAIVGRRLVRAGKFADAREYLPEDAQHTLEEYAELLKSGNDPHAAKAARSEALWKAANLISEKGEALFDYALPSAMAERMSGRAVEEGSYPETTITFGKPEKLLPPVTEKERARLKENSLPALHRRYSNYVAADLGWKSAALLPDNDEQTARLLNTAGSWLKNRDEKAADRFYQAIERRCARTEIGKQAIKKHWFVETSENAENSEPSPEPQSTP